MAEQILQIENVDPKDLHGPNDKYLDKVKALFPKLKIIARGDFVKVMGDEDEMEYFINRYEMLTMQLERKGKIDERDIEDIMKANTDMELQQKMSESDVLVLDTQALAMRYGTDTLAPVLGGAVVESDGHGDFVLELIEHRRGVHASRYDNHRVFHELWNADIKRCFTIS